MKISTKINLFSFLWLLALPFFALGQTYTGEHTNNLQIAYVIPQGMVAEANYQTRLSAVMIYAQQYYKDEMAAHGYPNKTFGLFKDATGQSVRIELIQSSKTPTELTNGTTLTKVVNDYYTAQGITKSQHTLILLPSFSYDGLTNGGAGTQPNADQPFYGSGKNCIAMDNIYMDMAWKTNKNPTGRDNFAKWVGGMMHEVGHALQLPHNNEPAPISGEMRDHYDPAKQKTNFPSTYRPSLMGIGNFTLDLYAPNNTILTEADCAMLDVNEIFNNDNKSYYGTAQSGVPSMHAVYNSITSNIEISGKFKVSTSGRSVKHVVIYLDPNVNNEGIGTNKDYNAISYKITPINTDSFYLSVPISALSYKANTPTEIKVKLVHDNGTIVENAQTFKFEANAPQIPYNVVPTNYTIASRSTAWTAVATSKSPKSGGTAAPDQQASSGDESAGGLVDNNYVTVWHTPWSDVNKVTSFPHEITVDTKQAQNIAAWSILQRASLAQSVKDVELSGSNDGTAFTPIKSYTLKDEAGLQWLPFDSQLSYRYYRLKALNSYRNTDLLALVEFNLWTGPIYNGVQPATTLVDRTGWIATAGSKTATGGTTVADEENSTSQAAQTVLDGNESNFWHSKYTGLTVAFPHEIVIDTRAKQRFTSWAYYQRNSLTRNIKDAEISISDDNINWTKIGDYVLLSNKEMNVLSLGGAKEFRYFKIKASSTYDTDGSKHSALAEVYLYNDPNVTLPVNLTAFNAKTVGNSVRLNWTTLSEQNSDYFEVIRIADNGTYSTVAKLNAAGNANSQLNYQATDYNPKSGVNYYQLWQFDKDQTLATKSEVKSATVLAKTESLSITSITPGNMLLNVNAIKPGRCNLTITNVLGQRLAFKQVSLQEGNNSINLNFQATGVLLVSADLATGRSTKKFIAP